MGVGGMTAGAGSTPPSVPMTTQFGPMLAGSGTPPVRPSLGHWTGKPDVVTAGTIPTSVPGAMPVPAKGAGQVAPTVGVYWLMPQAWNHERLKVRSLATLKMRKRYGFGS